MLKKIKFVALFAPALVFYPLGLFVTACRLAYAEGRSDAVMMLADVLASKKK